MYDINIRTMDDKMSIKEIKLNKISNDDLNEILNDFRNNRVIFLKNKNLYLSNRYVISIEFISEEEKRKKMEKDERKLQKLKETLGKY